MYIHDTYISQVYVLYILYKLYLYKTSAIIMRHFFTLQILWCQYFYGISKNFHKYFQLKAKYHLKVGTYMIKNTIDFLLKFPCSNQNYLILVFFAQWFFFIFWVCCDYQYTVFQYRAVCVCVCVDVNWSVLNPMVSVIKLQFLCHSLVSFTFTHWQD